jgi:hypothetical protein
LCADDAEEDMEDDLADGNASKAARKLAKNVEMVVGNALAAVIVAAPPAGLAVQALNRRTSKTDLFTKTDLLPFTPKTLHY